MRGSGLAAADEGSGHRVESGSSRGAWSNARKGVQELNWSPSAARELTSKSPALPPPRSPRPHPMS